MKEEKMKKQTTFLLMILTILILSIGTFKIYGESFTGTIIEMIEDQEDYVGYESLFEKGTVTDIYIEIEEESWENILEDPLAESYEKVILKVADEIYEDVGFRTKGNSTLKSVARDEDSDRYSFKINLNKYNKNQLMMGLDEFVLNNNYSDPSYIREYLSYEILRDLGEKVPLVTFANLYINGELYGLYTMVESVEDSFLEREFQNSTGNLYKADQGSSLKFEESSTYDTLEQKSGKDKSKDDLTRLIKVLNDMPEGEKGDIEEVLDVNSALRYFAVNYVLGNYDSYHGNRSHNYYLYSIDGKFTLIPWDYNMSFGGFGGNRGSASLYEPIGQGTLDEYPLIKNLLAVDEYRVIYEDYVKELVDGLENFEEEFNLIADMIRPFVENDPTNFYTLEQFESSYIYQENEKSSLDQMANAPDFSQRPQMNKMPENMNGIEPPARGEFLKDELRRPDTENREIERPNNMGNMMQGGSLINFMRENLSKIKGELN